jgi:hypothetical protein
MVDDDDDDDDMQGYDAENMSNDGDATGPMSKESTGKKPIISISPTRPKTKFPHDLFKLFCIA